MKSEHSSFDYLLNDIKLALKPAEKFFFLFFPFVLLSLLFILLFLYFLITNEGGIKATLLKLILLPAFIANILLLHVVLQKYFGRKKLMLVWTIEFIVSALALYLFM